MWNPELDEEGSAEQTVLGWSNGWLSSSKGMKFIDIPTEQTTAVTDAILALLSVGGVLYLRQIARETPGSGPVGLGFWSAGSCRWIRSRCPRFPDV